MRSEVLTGLSYGQLVELSARVAATNADVVHPNGRPASIGMFRSVALVVYLMRRNPVQAEAGAHFGVSQPTVSRRWDQLRPAIAAALAGCVPNPGEVAGIGSVLVDGTIAPTWDWKAIPDLYSAKAGYAGINIQIAATLDGHVAAIGQVPVHGARHDAYAFHACGLADRLTTMHVVADLGYPGVDGVALTPHKRAPGADLNDAEASFNTALSAIRAPVEHAVAQLKTWRMLSEQGGRYRCPIHKYQEMLQAVTELFFFREGFPPYE